ncbi:MAG TPA: GspE/PulE family protein [Longimicrobiaceae bacterium]|nr:GspE/PulE family protein [Longimicrobiaceae bacterium]
MPSPRMDPASHPSPPVPALTVEYLRHWRLVPRRDAAGLRVLADGPPDLQALDDLRWLHGGEEPAVEIVGEDEMEAALLRAEEEQAETAATLIASLGGPADAAPAESGEGDLLAQAQEVPVVRLVNLLLMEALEARASDLHLEAGRGRVQVRYRVDGVLVDAPSPPAALVPAVVGRLKVMAELDVAERRRPQDGRVRLRLEERSVDVRVSTLPTLHGESVVLRLLESEGRRLGLEDLGMAPDTRARFEELLACPHGVLLTTGPTGSGKTTTLYAALEQIRTGREKIVTVEDPVEYALGGVAQVPVNRKAGVTFASALRSILRQDPDVILVGEMRDTETAEICVQAALTGHLVLSTLHTNDAAGAIVRLTDLEVEPYLVASTVEGVLAQRLVRVVCRHCAEEHPLPPPVAREMEAAGCPAERFRRGRGCPECRGTGYRGRTGVYELLVVDEEVRTEVLRGRGVGTLRQIALANGMRPLRSDGWRQVAAGVTTPEEVLRVSHA